MIASSRGSNSRAGAASLKHRMPAIIGAFRSNRDCSSVAEQQPDKLWDASSTLAAASLFKTASQPSEPGLARAAGAN